jgi:hypothetical protein
MKRRIREFGAEFEPLFNQDELRELFRSPCMCFKGGDAGNSPDPQLADSAVRQYARGTMYPMIQEGMEGRGYGPAALTTMRDQSARTSLKEGYEGAVTGMESEMFRTIPKADLRVKGFMRNELARNYITRQDQLERSLRQEKVADQDLSMGMAAENLAQETRMATNLSQMYNQALQANAMNRQQVGTFSTNVAAGAAGGMSDYYYAQQMGKKTA